MALKRPQKTCKQPPFPPRALLAVQRRSWNTLACSWRPPAAVGRATSAPGPCTPAPVTEALWLAQPLAPSAQALHHADTLTHRGSAKHGEATEKVTEGIARDRRPPSPPRAPGGCRSLGHWSASPGPLRRAPPPMTALTVEF